MDTVRYAMFSRHVRYAPEPRFVGPNQEHNCKVRTWHTLVIFAALAALPPICARADEGPRELDTFLNNNGARVEVHRRAAGDPYLDVSLSGTVWRVYFVECKGPPPAESCKSMTLQAGFSHTGTKTLEALNTWNATRRFSRAFLDNDGDPALATDVILQDAPSALVDQAVARWITDVDRFREFLK